MYPPSGLSWITNVPRPHPCFSLLLGKLRPHHYKARLRIRSPQRPWALRREGEVVLASV